MNSIVCDIRPETVRLNGEADVLAGIDQIVLATLYVEDLELTQQNSYVVTPPDGTWLVNGNEVARVEITLDGIDETTLTATDITYENLPAGLYGRAHDRRPDGASVGRGGRDRRGKAGEYQGLRRHERRHWARALSPCR